MKSNDPVLAAIGAILREEVAALREAIAATPATEIARTEITAQAREVKRYLRQFTDTRSRLIDAFGKDHPPHLVELDVLQ
jgi:hypothetical protein